MSASSRAAARVVKEAARLVDRLRAAKTGVVVLIYHRIGATSGLEVDLPAQLFEAQIAELAAARNVTTLGEALPALTGKSSDPNTPQVVVTFDDGTADFVDAAVPILQRYRVPALLYLATGFVEEQREFPGGGRPLSWSSLADACSTGVVDVGSHTHRHLLLDRLARSDVDDELDRSIGLIEDRLQRKAVDFAYPKAVRGSEAAERAVRTRFRSAALAGTTVNPYASTCAHRLARSPIQVSDGMRFFRAKVVGGMALEDHLRQLANRRRYAGAES